MNAEGDRCTASTYIMCGSQSNKTLVIDITGEPDNERRGG